MSIIISPTPTLWTPAAISTALWLDAADASTITTVSGAVSEWRDKSGNGIHVSQGVVSQRPTYVANALNNKPKINFDSNDFLVTTAYGGWANAGFYLAALCNLDNTTLPQFPAIVSENNSSNPGYLSLGGDQAFPRKIAISRTGQATTSSTLDFPRNSWGILGFESASGITGVSGSGTITLTPFLNGTSAAGISLGSLLTNSISTIIGASRLGAQDIFNGSISEIILCSTPTNLVRQQIEGYLAHKWGLTANLPSGHPYKSTPPYINFDPDAQVYINAVETADLQSLEPAVKSAINSFVVGCKQDGIWNAIKASCIMAGARTLAGALVPLKGTAPTNFNFVAGDYNRKTGLVGNGSTKYLNTNRNNNADPQDSNHNSVFVSTATSITSSYLGSSNGTGGTGANDFGRVVVPGYLFHRNRQNVASTSGTGSETGLIGASRANSANYVFRAGSVSSTVAAASQVPFNQNVSIFASGTGTSVSNARLSYYSIGESLDLALLDARVTTLMNTFATIIP